MKLKIVLTASGYCLIIGVSAFISWEHGIGAAALLGTIHSIITMFKKHGEVIVVPEATPSKASHKQPKTAQVSSKSNTTKEEVAELAGFNTDIFKQFQNNLQDYQKTSPNQKSVQETLQLPANTLQNKSANPYLQKSTKSENKESFEETLELEQDDKVTLTQKKQTPVPKEKDPSVAVKEKSSTPAPFEGSSAKNGSQKSKIAPKPEAKINTATNKNEGLLKSLSQPLDGVGDDLFADVQITLPSEKPRPAPKHPPQPQNPTGLFDEGLGDSLHANHSPEEKSAEAAALLKMAQTAFQAGHVSEAKAGLDNFFSIQQELDPPPHWEVQYLSAQVYLRLGDIAQALSSFSEMTQNGLEPSHPDYANILESITTSLEEYQLYEEVLPFLYDLLNYYRQQLLDRVQMDRIYERLERALEELGDDERLIRTYKNHLEIKRILKDQFGESQLLDALGNRHYKMGDKELSRKYYEENLHLKTLMNKVESP